MSRRVLVVLVPGAAVLAVLAALGLFLALRGEDAASLGGAEEIASGRDLASARELVDDEELGPDSADLDLRHATRLAAASDRGLYVLLQSDGARPSGDWLLHVSGTAEIVEIGQAANADNPPSAEQTALAVLPDGSMAVVYEDSLGPHLAVVGFDFDGDATPERRPRFSVGAIGVRPDGSLLLASREGTQIDAAADGGTMTGLLGSPGSDAPVVLDAIPGPITALLGLADDRVVFVVDGQLFLLDESEVQPLDVPVEVEQIAPAPDGRVLVIGMGRQRDPVISVVEVASGEAEAEAEAEVEELAVLEDVELSSESPVSAAAVGDDLVFLADGKLWRLDDAL